MNPFTKRVSSLLPNQAHKRAIETDAHLRVKGAPLGELYAVGDCATVSYFICTRALALAINVESVDRDLDCKPLNGSRRGSRSG
jgi:hypothetical protein